MSDLSNMALVRGRFAFLKDVKDPHAILTQYRHKVTPLQKDKKKLEERIRPCPSLLRLVKSGCCDEKAKIQWTRGLTWHQTVEVGQSDNGKVVLRESVSSWDGARRTSWRVDYH